MSADHPYSSAFQSTPPARGTTPPGSGIIILLVYFNPRPPRGGRLGVSDGGRCRPWHFNPRPPRGGRLRLLDSMTAEQRFQSTPPARGTTLRKTQWKPSTFISIHAPREGDDRCHHQKEGVLMISIHAPREGDDRGDSREPERRRHFNPRPPRGGRQPTSFSTFAALAFQSTPPARGTTTPL